MLTRPRARVVAFLTVVACFLSMHTAVANAQLLLMREHERMMDSGRVGLGLDLNTFFGNAHDAGYSFLQPSVLGSFRFRELVIEGALPFAYFHENNRPGEDENQLAMGNPWGALLYLPDCECGLSRLSVGLAAPVASDSSRLDALALSLSRSANGDWDGYLWRADMLPLVLGASTRKELGRFRLTWDADAIIGLPGGNREAQFGAQMAGEADVMFGWQTTLAGRISGTYYPTLADDEFQSALTTYLRYMRTTDSFALRFVLNLNPPAGFSFSSNGIWGAGLLYARSFL